MRPLPLLCLGCDLPPLLRAQLFLSLGTGQRAALLATIVTGIVNHCATYVSLWAADAFGRRVLFLQGGVQMFISLVRDTTAPSACMRAGSLCALNIISFRSS